MLVNGTKSCAVGRRSSLSSPYICIASPIWRRLPVQAMVLPFSLARPSVGKSMLARMEMIAITTSSSINVKARSRMFTLLSLADAVFQLSDHILDFDALLLGDVGAI